MTTLFDEEKGALNVTLIACEKNTVTANRTLEKDGYIALQVETKKTAKKTVRKEFRIDRAIVWNLLDERGERHGQAATFPL